MRKFVLGLAVVVLIEVIAAFFAVDHFTKVAAGTSILSIRILILTGLAIVIPPTIGYGLWWRAKSDRMRVAEIARRRAIQPDAVIFGAQFNDAFLAGMNRIRRVAGSPPLKDNKRPLIVTISKTFMSIDRTGVDRRTEGGAITLLTSMIYGVSAQSVVQKITGTRQAVSVETLHLRVAKGGELDLFIPVATNGIAPTTRAEVEAIVAQVRAVLGLESRV